MCVAERLTASFAPFGCGSASAVFPGLHHSDPYQIGQPASASLAQCTARARVQAPTERRIWRRSAERARPCGTSGGRCAGRPRGNMALHTAAPTPPPGADSPMHSTRAQDASEPCIADFRRSPSGLHDFCTNPKIGSSRQDDGLLISEIAHFATILIVSQPQY